MPSVRDIYHFDELTWPEVNEAVAMGKIPIIPTGLVEQHGHHLPLKVDHLCADAVATEAARLRPELSLVLPPVSYGYVHHVMDFPGSLNIHFEHFIQYVLDICKSLAYHGFKKMIIVNGHGSNHPLCELVARRLVVETDASCAFCSWWQMLTVNPDFMPQWRESIYPGGCAHACELETSMLMYLSPESVRMDKIKNEIAKTNQYGSKYIYVDLFGGGPMGLVEWTSQYSDSGVMGEAEKATAEKGKLAFDEASRNLANFVAEYYDRKIAPRTSHMAQAPTFHYLFQPISAQSVRQTKSEQPMRAELKVGVIGCGGHAQSHFAMIKAEPRLKLIAIAEVDEQRRAKVKAEHQPEEVFGDYREMLEKTQLDLVYVVTLAGHLLPIVQECLGRDLHTSIEKAPGYTTAETRQMVEAAHKSKGKAIVSFNRRYMPEILAVRRLAQARGGAVQVAANYHKPPSGMVPPDRQAVVPPELTSDAIHHVDLIRWMAGRTQAEARTALEVYAHTWRGVGVPAPHHNAVIKFDDHTHGVMMSHFGVGFRIQSAEVHAEDMSAYLDLTDKPKVTLYLDGKLVVEPLDLEAVGGPAFNETRHFVDCILNDREPWSTIDDAVKTMELCEAIVVGHHGKL